MFMSTTILAVRHRDRAVLAGDGQVTFGQTVVKQRARKIRRLYNDRILAGFAGSAADSFALFARFESKLEQYRGNLERSAVELAKDWRSDRILRRLEAMMEAGEVPTIEGQSHGRRDLITGFMRVADPTRPIPARSNLKDTFAARRRLA